MKPSEPEPVKLFVGILFRDEQRLARALGLLEEKFGRTDYKSQEFEFDVTDYYADEMGPLVFRKFASFIELIAPNRLARIKLETNDIEQQLAIDGRRTVNLDPGYMDYHKVVLASAKFNGQKIYLDFGIYADPALWYEKGEFRPYPFAFPDFKTGRYSQAFLHMRALYKGQRRKQSREAENAP